jgi:hypothetical protein
VFRHAIKSRPVLRASEIRLGLIGTSLDAVCDSGAGSERTTARRWHQFGISCENASLDDCDRTCVGSLTTVNEVWNRIRA